MVRITGMYIYRCPIKIVQMFKVRAIYKNRTMAVPLNALRSTVSVQTRAVDDNCSGVIATPALEFMFEAADAAALVALV